MMKPTQQQLKNQKKQPKPPQPPRKPTAPRSQAQQQSVIEADLQLDPGQEAIISLIQEYLLRLNLINTLDVLQREILSQEPQNTQDNQASIEILQAFESGDQETFFSLWNRFVPVNTRKDDFVMKLEFYIQIFFLIYEIHPKTGKKGGQISKPVIAAFKHYLDTKGAEYNLLFLARLSKTNEFLHFYALPYVQKPAEHQSYKHLFTAQWAIELKVKLGTFLAELTAKDQPTMIEQMYHQYTNEEIPQKNTNMSQSNNQNYTTQLEINNQELLGVIQDYNLKYNQMQKKFKEFIDQSKTTMIEAQQKWYTNAKEMLNLQNDLVRIISNSQKGIIIQNNELDIYKRKIEKYERFFSLSVEEIISQSNEISVFEKAFENDLSISPIPQSIQSKQQFNFNNSQVDKENYVQLDYNKIHQIFLTNANPDMLCRVLQGLRWRVTKAKGAYLRREVLILYAQYDIIGCNPRNTILLQKLLVDCTDQVREYSLRLINAMASDYQGRSYLMESFVLVKTLIEILKREKTDTLIRRNSLGALQKLSLRRKPQIIMIENDVIRWIVRTLKQEKDTLSEYSYEYATALFMNLSMRQKGKHKCEDPREQVLMVLNDLLEHDNMQVRTFVNGTLYSLFSIKSLRNQARELGMQEVLEVLMKSSDERFIKQIQYIIEQLNSNRPDEEDQDEENDVDDIDDIDDNEEVGEEEETEDVLEQKDGQLNGEELLVKYFALNGQEALIQTNLTKSIMEEGKNKRSHMDQSHNVSQHPFRPTTPIMSASQIKSPSQERIPSELKSRPKIARTPHTNERSMVSNNSSVEEQKTNEPIKPTAEVKPSKKPYEENEEVLDQNIKFKIGFETRPKIARTPPDGHNPRR